jgi:hypothetical protein
MKKLVIFLSIVAIIFFSIDLPQTTWVSPPAKGSTLEKILAEEISFHTQPDGDIFMEEVKLKFPQEKPLFFIVKSHHGDSSNYTVGVADPTGFMALANFLEKSNLNKKNQLEI